jgi:hypothetical protein
VTGDLMPTLAPGTGSPARPRASWPLLGTLRDTRGHRRPIGPRLQRGGYRSRCAPAPQTAPARSEQDRSLRQRPEHASSPFSPHHAGLRLQTPACRIPFGGAGRRSDFCGTPGRRRARGSKGDNSAPHAASAAVVCARDDGPPLPIWQPASKALRRIVAKIVLRMKWYLFRALRDSVHEHAVPPPTRACVGHNVTIVHGL